MHWYVIERLGGAIVGVCHGRFEVGCGELDVLFGRRCRGAVWSGAHCLTSTFPIMVGSAVSCVRNLRGSICWVQVGHVAEDGVEWA